MLENENTQNSKAKPLIGLLLILISLVGYAFLIRPLGSDYNTLKTDLISKTNEQAQLQQQIEDFEQAEKELDLATEVQRFEARKAIPAGMNQDDVIRDLMKILKNHDIELNSLGFGKSATSKDGVSMLRVNAGFEGNYSDLINFLKGIEQNSRLFQVENISVQINPLKVTGFKRVNFSLSINAFYQE